MKVEKIENRILKYRVYDERKAHWQKERIKI